jgi:hypothetical protein
MGHALKICPLPPPRSGWPEGPRVTSAFWLLCLFILAGPILSHADDDTPLQPIPETKRIPGTEINQPAPPAIGSTKPQPPPFIIGVWCQPSRSFAVWKARGVNTAVGYESESNTVSLDQWCNSAEFNEMWMIRQPRPIPADDRDEPFLLAWMQQDEPDVHDTPAEALRSVYGRLHTVDPSRPVLLNISGGNLLFNKTPRATYEQYFADADWIGNDLYPITGWNQPTWLPRVGQAVDQCRQISQGKPQFAFIETSQQRLAWAPKNTPGVTPAQLRVEIWDAVIHGVKGIVYFPDQFNPFNFDGTPISVSVEMAKNDALLAQIAPALVNTSNAPKMTASVDAPLEVAWRTTPDGTAYVLVLNLSPDHQDGATIRLTGFPVGAGNVLNQDNKSLNITANGFTDDFSPHDLHIYMISPSTPQSKR